MHTDCFLFSFIQTAFIQSFLDSWAVTQLCVDSQLHGHVLYIWVYIAACMFHVSLLYMQSPLHTLFCAEIVGWACRIVHILQRSLVPGSLSCTIDFTHVYVPEQGGLGTRLWSRWWRWLDWWMQTCAASGAVHSCSNHKTKSNHTVECSHGNLIIKTC